MNEVIAQAQAGMLRVTINRPERRNALSRAVLDGLRHAFEFHVTDDSLQCAVLTGAGDRSFAAGGDLAEFDALRGADDARDLFDAAAAALDAVRNFPTPVIAALNGTALGGGAELAMACDYRVCAAHANFGFVQSTLAITTGFGGGADLFRMLGSAAAMHALATGEAWPAQTAKAMGLIDVIAASGQTLDEAVSEFAKPFFERPPHLVRAIKHVANAHRLHAESVRVAERDSFVRTWTNSAHWNAVERMLAAREAEKAKKAKKAQQE